MTKHIDSCSGHDTPRVGNVQSVEAYPWHASRVLRHLDRLVSGWSYYECQGFRYVTDNLILCMLLNRPLDQLMIITQVLDYSICESQVVVPFSVVVLQPAAQVILGTLMCLLAVIRFIRESLQMYRVIKRFDISRYLSLLTRDSILYFLSYVYALSFDPFPFPCYQTNGELLRTASCHFPSSICWPP